MNDSRMLPTSADCEAMWGVVDFPVHRGSYPRVVEYVEALQRRFGRDVYFESFSIPAHPVFDWYLQRNRLHECSFFERFWKAPNPASYFPHKTLPLDFGDMSLFEPMTAFHFGGDLSSTLYRGGAYCTPSGYGSEARRLGEAAAGELLLDDYEGSLFFRSQSAWSEFFEDVCWDYTAVLISKPLRLVHVIVATDSD